MQERTGPSAAAIETYWLPRCVFSFGHHRVVVDGFVSGMEPCSDRSPALSRNASVEVPSSLSRGLSGAGSVSTQALMPTPVTDVPRTTYILSHYHSDHYMGIRSTFNRGNIFCTRITARLLESGLGVSPMLLRPLDLGVMYRIDTTTGDLVDERRGLREPWSVDLMLVDANHCPGAAMIVFWTNSGIIVHTGDFRFSPPPGFLDAESARLGATKAPPPLVRSQAPKIGSSLGRRNPPRRGGFASQSTPKAGGAATPAAPAAPAVDFQHPLASFRGKVDKLYLDNTFCDPKYAFPAQDDSVALACARAQPLLSKSKGKKLVAFGTYTIGKERFAFGCRDQLGPGVSIFAAPAKYSLLKQCELVEGRHVALLPIPDDAAYAGCTLTAADLCTAANGDTVFVFVPLDAFGYKKLQAEPGMLCLAANFKIDMNGFDCVVGFEPTGWAASVTPSQREKKFGKLMRLSIPYSEHCSWTELLDFVGYLNPKEVVPTVSEDQYRKHETLFAERARQLKLKSGSVRPITAFFKRHRAEMPSATSHAEEEPIEVSDDDDDGGVATCAPRQQSATATTRSDDEAWEVMSDDGVMLDRRDGSAIEII